MTTDVYVEQSWIEIPQVVGMTVREATERLTEAGFSPVASTRRFTADADDVVGGTLPPEGSLLLRTARVDLLPARKEAAILFVDEQLTADELLNQGIMPDLSGMTVNDALALLQGHGFHTWPRPGFTDRIEPDFVWFTDPRAGQAANVEPVVVWYAVPVPMVEKVDLTDQQTLPPDGTDTTTVLTS